MPTVHLELPAELFVLAGDTDIPPSEAASQLIALELFREHRISLGKAAELAGMAQENFLTFSAQRGVPLHYAGSDWETDHEAAKALAL
jgi:predicted HTH domain antitoxin